MKCPKCLESPERKEKPGEVIVKQARKGRRRMFWGCNRYPDCDWATWNDPTKTPEELAAEKETAKLAKTKKTEDTDEPEPTDPSEES